MIYYTLLPKNERKFLRREYRVRLLIVALFFISSALAVGIIALLPSYILTDSMAKKAMTQTEELEKIREAKGAVQIEKDLAQSRTIAGKILAEADGFSTSVIVNKILAHRLSAILISSLDVTYSESTSTPAEVIIQGKALSRAALISFRKSLEDDAGFTGVELPVSDLAKSADISFAMRLNVLK